MSSIPKSERPESKLQQFHEIIAVRKEVTQLLKVMFLQKQKKLDVLSRMLLTASKLPKRKEVEDKIRTEKFEMELIKDEIKVVASICREMMSHLRTANTIYPTYMVEFNERRLEMDRTLCSCNDLQGELQYVAESVYLDKNKFTPLALKIQKIFNGVKKLRQADNRFLKTLKDGNRR